MINNNDLLTLKSMGMAKPRYRIEWVVAQFPIGSKVVGCNIVPINGLAEIQYFAITRKRFFSLFKYDNV
jgi:hypothetical protein